jgi:hypothetical protein
MDLWFGTLSYRERGKLKIHRTSWRRHGANIIALRPQHGKTVRKNKKLKREREARLKAEQAAYVARRDLPPPIASGCIAIEQSDSFLVSVDHLAKTRQ